MNMRNNLIEKFIPVNNFIGFMKMLIKISKNLNSEELHANIITEVMKDYSFSKTLFDKLEDFLNLFFEKQ
jgi:hypothetical protein